MQLLKYSQFIGKDFSSPVWLHTKGAQLIAMTLHLQEVLQPQDFCAEIGPHANFKVLEQLPCRHPAVIEPYNGSEGAGLAEVPPLPYPFVLFRCALGETSAVIPDSLFDYTYSISVLEHIGQAEANYDCQPTSEPPLAQESKRQAFCHELFRITKPGGITVHTIDHAARNLSYHHNFTAAGFESLCPPEQFCTVEQALSEPDAVRQRLGWLGERTMPPEEQALHAVLWAAYRRPLQELAEARETAELLSRQLLQVQEELAYYFRENQALRQGNKRKDEKLDWLRAQRESLLRMLGQQARLQQRFITLAARTAFALRGLLRP